MNQCELSLLFVVSQRKHHIKQFFKRDESTTMRNFVVVHGIGEFRDVRARMSLSVSKLATFSRIRRAGITATSIDKPGFGH